MKTWKKTRVFLHPPTRSVGGVVSFQAKVKLLTQDPPKTTRVESTYTRHERAFPAPLGNYLYHATLDNDHQYRILQANPEFFENS